MKGETLLL